MLISGFSVLEPGTVSAEILMWMKHPMKHALATTSMALLRPDRTQTLSTGVRSTILLDSLAHLTDKARRHTLRSV